MTTFTFDEVACRAALAALDPDELPSIWMGSPARAIDEFFCDLGLPHLTKPDGWDILLNPLVFESDADMMVVKVARKYPAPALCITMDWDDLVEGPREEHILADPLSIDQIVSTIQNVVTYANVLVADEIASQTPLIVVVRDPDASNEFHVYGGNVDTIDVDLGRACLEDEGEFAEWAESYLGEAETIEQAHPEAAELIRLIVNENRAAHGHPEPEGT